MSNIEGKTTAEANWDVEDILGDVATISDEDLVPEEEISADPHVGRMLDGRFRIDSLIAIGGMGRVYRAHQASLDRTVAVKILSIPPGASLKDPDFEERFALEAATASRINHPNTVTIFDFGQTADGVFYIVMEYIEGVPLSRVLRAERRLHPARALHLARQVCRALRVAHARGVIHRDLKPSNILLVHTSDEGDVAKILDFGLAKLVASSRKQGTGLTRIGTFIGTPEYAAPEVSQKGLSDVRSDVYSVGVMLYRMLTGRVPFRGPTDAASIMMTVHNAVPPFPSELAISSRVESLVMKCLEKDPARRYQTMDELLAPMGTCLVELGVETASLMAPSVVAPSVVTQLGAVSPAHEQLGPAPTPRRGGGGGWSPSTVGVVALAVFAVVLGVGRLLFSGEGGQGRDGLTRPDAPIAAPALEDRLPLQEPRVIERTTRSEEDEAPLVVAPVQATPPSAAVEEPQAPPEAVVAKPRAPVIEVLKDTVEAPKAPEPEPEPEATPAPPPAEQPAVPPEEPIAKVPEGEAPDPVTKAVNADPDPASQPAQPRGDAAAPQPPAGDAPAVAPPATEAPGGEVPEGYKASPY